MRVAASDIVPPIYRVSPMLSPPKRQFTIFLSDGFSLLAFGGLTAPLKIANDLLGYKAYAWHTVSRDGGMVLTSCGSRIEADQDINVARADKQIDKNRVLALFIGDAPEELPPSLIPWVRECLSRGAQVAGIGRGALALAAHGLLDERRCAVHWSRLASSLENYPRVDLSERYFVIDGALQTCAGEAAASDLTLEIVTRDFGVDLASSVTEMALMGKTRGHDERQKMALQSRFEYFGSSLLPIVKLMEETIAEPMGIDAVAVTCGISRRQIERLFSQYLGISPHRYYCQLRIERARCLLLDTKLTLLEVAMATGFVSQSHFAKAYRTVVGCSPLETRTGRKRSVRNADEAQLAVPV